MSGDKWFKNWVGTLFLNDVMTKHVHCTLNESIKTLFCVKLTKLIIIITKPHFKLKKQLKTFSLYCASVV